MSEPGPGVPAETVPSAPIVTILATGQKVKRRLLRMRACDEKDGKNKICAGHLKRWYGFGPEITDRFGEEAEIYRCEKCRTLYLPNEAEVPRTRTLAY